MNGGIDLRAAYTRSILVVIRHPSRQSSRLAQALVAGGPRRCRRESAHGFAAARMVAVARTLGIPEARLWPRALFARSRRTRLALPNGPLMAEAPTMAALLRDLVAGGQVDALRTQAAAILRWIDRGRPREPGEMSKGVLASFVDRLSDALGQIEQVVVPHAVCIRSNILAVRSVHYANIGTSPMSKDVERIASVVDCVDHFLSGPAPVLAAKMRDSLMRIVSGHSANARYSDVWHCNLHPTLVSHHCGKTALGRLVPGSADLRPILASELVASHE